MVRMGNYETVELVAEVTLDTEEDAARIGADATEPEIATYIDRTLDELLFADVEDAKYQTADEDSFIHDHHTQMLQRSK